MSEVWAVVPAAGIGSRMAAELPKQYLPLAGTTVLQQTLARLLDWQGCQAIVVALHPQDDYFEARLDPHAGVETVIGGAERCHSVLAGLDHLAGRADDQDWVLVHDAARPCITSVLLNSLMEALATDPVGGLLALPVADTVKQAGPDQRVARTLPREELWLAQTPQVFRFGLLREALGNALSAGVLVTDEAAAMERAGHSPKLVPGDVANLKITVPADLALAEARLQQEAGNP